MALQVLTEILEYGGIRRRNRGEVIECLVHAGCQTRGGDVMPENSAVHHLRKERCSWEQLPHHVRNIFLTFRSECLLIARTASECDDHDFLFPWEVCCAGKRGKR